MRFLAEVRSCAASIHTSSDSCCLKISYWADVILPGIIAAKGDRPPVGQNSNSLSGLTLQLTLRSGYTLMCIELRRQVVALWRMDWMPYFRSLRPLMALPVERDNYA